MTIRVIEEFINKLLVAKELRFDSEGRLTLLGQRVLIVPAQLILLLIEQYVKDRRLEKKVYETMKQSVYEFARTLAKEREVTREQMVEILTKLAVVNGYGFLTLKKLDYKNKIAVFLMKGMPSEKLRGRIKGRKAVDTYWAGMLAGGAAHIFNDKKVECKETRCVVMGKESCEFVVRIK